MADFVDMLWLAVPAFQEAAPAAEAVGRRCTSGCFGLVDLASIPFASLATISQTPCDV